MATTLKAFAEVSTLGSCTQYVTGNSNFFISASKAREIERRYFDVDKIGNLLNQKASSRCGSDNLAKELAGMLQRMIDQQIPSMKSKLMDLIARTEEDSLKAGKAIAKGEVRENLTKLSQELERLVASHLNAVGVDKHIWHQINHELHDAAYKIQQTAPLFNINGRLISHEVLLSNVNAEKPTLMLQLDKGQLSGTSPVESKETVVGGAGWILVFLPDPNKAQIKLKCTKLPRGACSVKATYTISAANAHHPCTNDYTFSLEGESDGFDVSFKGDERCNVEANVDIKVSSSRKVQLSATSILP